MFICEDCLENYKNFALPISFGKCEDCGKSKPCADIHHRNLEKRGIKIFDMDGGITWIAAATPKSAKIGFAEYLGCKDLAEYIRDYGDDEPEQMTPIQMEHYKFVEDDDEGNPRQGEKKTFTQKLAEMIENGEKFPCFFASTEY